MPPQHLCFWNINFRQPKWKKDWNKVKTIGKISLGLLEILKINQPNLKKADDHKEWTGKTIYFNFSSNFGIFFEIFLLKQSNKKESRVEQKTKINVFSDYSLISMANYAYFTPKSVLTPQKKNSCIIFKIDIFSKFFGDAMSHIIR